MSRFAVLRFAAIALGLTLAASVAGTPGLAKVCGGVLPPQQCGPHEFCQTPPGRCSPSALGTCTFRPNPCMKIYLPVCGCNGETYSNDCHRLAAGVSLAHPGKCFETP